MGALLSPDQLIKLSLGIQVRVGVSGKVLGAFMVSIFGRERDSGINRTTLTFWDLFVLGDEVFWGSAELVVCTY